MEKSRLWLTYPGNLITEPLLYRLGQEFKIVTNIRQASVSSEVGIISVVLEGERAEIKNAIRWLEEQGVQVEPVEIQTIEG